MPRWPMYTFLSMVIMACLFLLLTVSSLPDPVATKFYGGGKVGSVMSRSGYLLFMLALTIGLPTLVLLALGWFPVWFKRRSKFAHSDYWLAPPRLEQTLHYLRNRGCWIGTMAAAFCAATHGFILDAHAHTPPQPAMWPFGFAVVLFVLVTVTMALAIHLHFRRRPAG